MGGGGGGVVAPADVVVDELTGGMWFLNLPALRGAVGATVGAAL